MEKNGGFGGFDDIQKLFKHIESRTGPGSSEGDAVTPEELKEAYDKFQKGYEFNPGMLLKWKNGLKNREYPKYNEPAIIMEVLAPPIQNQEEESGSAYFREPMDLIMGVKIGDKFLTFHYDGRRFEPYE